MRKIGIVLVGLGAFLLVVGLMVRFYVYPSLAVAPGNPDSVTSLEAKDATIFDRGTLEEITTDIQTEVITIGDTEADAPDGTVVWISKSSTRMADGTILKRGVDRAPIDEVSGEAVNCCGAYVEVEEGDRQPANRKGLVFKFPFNTQKETYDFWDSDTGQAWPAKFVRTEDVQGLETYVFEQEVPLSKVGEMELPADMLGEPGDETLTANMTYANKRTFWIDPNTGGLVNRTEELDNAISYSDDPNDPIGTPRITTTKAHVSFTDDQVAENVKTYKDQGGKLALIRNTVPLVLGILGAVLLLLGVVLGARRRESNA